MEENDEEQADTVYQVLDLDYDVAQAFCSHTIPNAVLLFTGEALDNGMYFELDDGDNRKENGGDDEVGGGMGSPFTASAKTVGE